MLLKTLLIASSLMVADGRQMLRNQNDRDLAWGGSAQPIKKSPVKGSGKKTLIMRKKKGSGKKKMSNVKPSKLKPAKVYHVKDTIKPGKPASVTGNKWGGGVQPLVTPKPTRRPTNWGDDGFQPLVTPKPTRKPTRKPSSKWGNDGHCMYRPNADFTKCTNDDNVSSNYMYNTLEKCCEAVFGKGECNYEEVCEPCEEQLFFFDGDKCVNDVFFVDAPAYSTAVACCNLNFGIGSYGRGDCDYVDICAPAPVVTPSPTPCEDMVFFLDGNTCTNDVYIADVVSYNNPIICCNVNFGPGSINNGLCNIVDICNTPYPTPDPTPRPTPRPTPKPVTPAPTPCEDMLFFVDGDTCTNDVYIADAMSFSSAVACCNMNFGVGSISNGNCKVVDICNPTPAPTPCEDQVFFFDGDICSNEIYIADAAAFATAVACCNVNFGIGSLAMGKCDYVDTCNPQPVDTPEPTPSPTSCEEREWYISVDGDYTICTNGYDFSSNTSLYGSLSDCCDALGTTCYYSDVCVTPSPSYSPTYASTSGSTPTVSKETTGPPTMTYGRGD